MLFIIPRGLRLIGLSVLMVVPLSLTLSMAQLYTVCPSGCPFTKIQAALDAANEGDTITVGPGVYREHLKITKSVSLIGAGAAQTRLIPAQPGIDLFLVELGDFDNPQPLGQVRLEGFTFQGPLSDNSLALINNHAPIRSLQLRQNIFNNFDRRGVWIYYAEEIVAEGNRSVNTPITLYFDGGRRIRVAGNQVEGISVNPDWRDDRGAEVQAEAEVVDNDVREGIGVSGNTVVRGNRIRGGSIGVGLGPRKTVDYIQVINNELIGPGVLRRRSIPPGISWGIYIGDSGDRVLIEGNKISNYDAGILVDTFFNPPPQVQIRKNAISQGLWGIYFKELLRESSRFEIVDNTIDRQKSPDSDFPLLGAGIFVDTTVGQEEVGKPEIFMQGNTIRLGDFGVLLMPGSGKFEFQGNTITDNDLFGVLLAVPPCGEIVDPAKVQVTGSGNNISNNGKRLKPEEKQVGDGEGNVCPKELMSLKR
jgi:hypothetical protein